MYYFRIHAASTVTAHNENSLISAWRQYGHTGLVAEFRTAFTPTEKQLARWPAGLKGILVVEG